LGRKGKAAFQREKREVNGVREKMKDRRGTENGIYAGRKKKIDKKEERTGSS